MPEISVIIVNWNGKHLLDECLGAMERQTFRDFETILVDNGSSDGSPEYVRMRFPDVKLVTLPENRGFTGGNLAGYEQAKGKLIVLLNNDTEAQDGWLEEIYKASLVFPNAGSFASKMMYFNDRGRIENCGFDLGLSGTTIDLGRDELDSPVWGTAREVFGPCGGAAVYRRSMLDNIGFLDPDFFAVFEDVDLSFRAQLHGYSCIYIPTAIVFHRYRATLRPRSATEVFYSQRNIEFVYLKNMPGGLILRSAPQKLMYEVGAAIYFMKQGRGGVLFRAKWNALKHFRTLLRKRHKVQQSRTVDSSRMLELMKPTFSSKWRKFRRFWRQSFQTGTAS
jgi:GT2 family glycosyltransferase